MIWYNYRSILLTLSFLVLIACAKAPPAYNLEAQKSNTSSLLIGLDALTDSVVWASGTEGTVIRTTNGGSYWESFRYDNADSLQFRDIYGFSDSRAAVLSIGQGPLSQIFLFDVDSGWTLRYQAVDSAIFLDALDFWNDSLGLAYGDAIDSLPFILKTVDGGKTWKRLIEGLPLAGNNEGGFASSGTLLEMGEKGKAWIGTGAGGNARILYTNNYGKSWQSLPTPMAKGDAAGITSVRFIGNVGFIAGGDLSDQDFQRDNLFFSDTRGNSWYPAGQPKTPGPVYGSAFTKIDDQYITLICGPKGANISFDMGQTWEKITPQNLWTCELLQSGTGWLMGKGGNILKVTIDK